MKKLFALLICAVLPCLCACGQAEPEETTAVTTVVGETSTTTEPTTTEATAAPTERYPTVAAKRAEPVRRGDDPYYAVIKAYCDFALNTPPYEGVPKLPEAGSAAIALQESQVQRVVYALHDINGDGVQELLMGAWNGYSTELYDIYTIKGGVAALQLQTPDPDHFGSRILKNGTVATSSGLHGDHYFGCHRFVNGRIKDCVTLNSREIYHPQEDSHSMEYYRIMESGANEEISKKEFERIQKQYDDGTEVSPLWFPLWAYGQKYASYKQAYQAVLLHYADAIQACFGGQYTALADIYGGSTPELIFRLQYPDGDGAYLQIWTFKEGKPRWLIAYYSDITALFTDKAGTIYTFHTYHRSDGWHTLETFSVEENALSQLGGKRYGRDSREDATWSGDGDDKAVSKILGSVDKMIFNLGINAASIYPKEGWKETYILREPLWDTYLAQHGGTDERMHISELLALLRGQAS